MDGQEGRRNVIGRIAIDYRRVTTLEAKHPLHAGNNHIIWTYTERLLIDRATNTITHTQNVGSDCIISRKYMVKDSVEELLGFLDADHLFQTIEGNPPDTIELPFETKDYLITIDLQNNSQRVIIAGAYDKKGLPNDWAEFITTVFDFISFYGWGEIFDPSIYGKRMRRRDDLIYCGVIFGGSSKRYYYITDDDTIGVGNFVLVPAGRNNRPVVVEVVNIQYFSEEDAPLPVNQTKRIIRKCTDEDFDLPGE